MARRYNTSAITSGPAAQSAVGDEPDWISAWTSETGGSFIRSFPITTAVSALALGERLELPAQMLSAVQSPAPTGSLISGVRITNGGTGFTSAPTVGFTGGGGSGAAGTAIVDAGAVVRIVITNPGVGYTGVPTVTFTGGGGTSSAGTAIRSGVDTEANALKAVEGITSVDWWLQAHDGNPGNSGTNNVISGLARFSQASTNWTTAT